jgi:phospholipase/carboxylesterase
MRYGRSMRIEQFGSLRARVTGGDDGQGGGQGPLVVLMHGFGAPAEDLVDLGDMLEAPAGTRFVFPEAPLLLDGGPGRAWWLLELEDFERRARGERVDRSQQVPDDLAKVRAALLELLDDVQSRLGAARERTVIGGFSQGAMLACDVALHAPQRPAGLLLMSGTLLAQRVWEPRMAGLAGMPVLMTHGTYDPLLAYDDAERLRDLLQAAGANVRFVGFRGAHEIPPVALDAASAFLVECLA